MRLLILILLLNLKLVSQSIYYDPDAIRYDDVVYSKNIKSAYLTKPENRLALPFLQLNTREKLLLTFDDLNLQSKGYYYKIVLCNYDWSPTDLPELEYIEGLNEVYFDNVRFSFNTTTKYSNYQVLIPSNEQNITKSGNYLLVVYEDGNFQKPLITKRFFVYENLISAVADVRLATNPDLRLTHQEINLSIDIANYKVDDPYSNLKIVIQQNGRKDNLLTLNRPKSITGNKLIYSYLNDINFEAGNEFRKLDLRTLLSNTGNIHNIEYDSNGYQVFLTPETDRSRSNYIRYQDINGKLLILNWDNSSKDSDIEADYANVYFQFQQRNLSFEGDYYIVGQFNDWQINQGSRLVYNPAQNRYVLPLKLKQGYYEYQYIYVQNESKSGTYVNTEGNFSQTENNYHILVYNREQGEMYDRLICFDTISLSGK